MDAMSEIKELREALKMELDRVRKQKQVLDQMQNTMHSARDAVESVASDLNECFAIFKAEAKKIDCEFNEFVHSPQVFLPGELNA